MFQQNLKNQECFPILKDKTQSKKKGQTETYGSTSQKDNEHIFQEFPKFEEPKYPIAVIFVLLSKTFESFAANGVRTVLALYFRDTLKFSEEFSTALLHVFNFFSQFFPIFGAILADSYLGNAKTIFVFCIPYALGYYLMFMATLPITLSIHYLVYCSLLLISIGNGNLRACIASLGGHQFELPEQKPQLDRYFSIYYFVYTLGILLSKIIPPEVRVSYQCFGEDDCYSAVFGMIAVIFSVSWFFFLIGMFFYKKETPTEGNVLFQVLDCVKIALGKKIMHGTEKGESWIDGAVGKYSQEFVDDVKAFFNILVLFIPLPLYWSLFAQQDSTWTFQATQLDTRVGDYLIPPDQVKALGPMLLLILIPLWQRFFVPLMKKHELELTSLECVSLGGLCAAFSFVYAGYLQIYIEEHPFNPPSVLWQIPQFFLLMMGEVWISIPGLRFSYTQAPQSMKSVLTAAWFVNNAMGNLIVVVITEIQPTEIQSIEFFLYAALMFIGISIFTLLARNYERNNMVISQDEVIEAFIYSQAVQSNNLEENLDEDCESIKSLERY